MQLNSSRKLKIRWTTLLYMTKMVVVFLAGFACGYGCRTCLQVLVPDTPSLCECLKGLQSCTITAIVVRSVKGSSR